jgi:hypothetical protein
MNPASTNLSNFLFYNNVGFIDNFDENYENLKNLKSLSFLNYKNVNFSITNSPLPLSYTTVLDSFRANFEESSWDIDSEYNLSNSTSLNYFNAAGVTNEVKLRSTAKNAIVTYNAIQKVYKSRFDELRSNINLNDLTKSFITYPF